MSDLIHANAAGLVGGYALCGDPYGDVAADETAVTCNFCLDIINDQLAEETLLAIERGLE